MVVLTPGVYNAAYFEHALLARLMGVELVEGRDLVCNGNRVRMRTTHGERPVHVVYRRVDDEFLDPLHFRPDSVIGCPGIVNAARAGNVTLANAIGNGVADDKLLYTYVPDLIRYYLGEEPVISNVETHRLDDADVLADVLSRLDELVLKPVDGAGGKGIVIGPQADETTLAALREAVAADPRGWIAQRPVALSTSPTLIGEKLAPRHIDLRPYAVNDGSDVWLLPGGLTRVALPEGTLVVNSSQGGGSKDTWVLASGSSAPAASVPAPERRTVHPGRHSPGCQRARRRPGRRPWPGNNSSSDDVDKGPLAMRSGMLSRIAESLFWIGRYVERADDTARILDAFLHRILEDPWVDEDAACRSLLAVLGSAAPHESRVTTGDVLELMGFDPDNPSSIGGALSSARENARGARETISSEMWECLNVTWHSLPSRRIAAEHLGPAMFLGFVRERAAVLAGLAESTMSRDDGWRFLVLGRSLERVDMTARLLSIQALALGTGRGCRRVDRAVAHRAAGLRSGRVVPAHARR